jgi:hypothetical protein
VRGARGLGFDELNPRLLSKSPGFDELNPRRLSRSPGFDELNPPPLSRLPGRWGALAVGVTLLLAGCTSAAPEAGGDAVPVVERWWSTADDAVGSVIEDGDPELAASRLSPDLTDYCQALDDTLAAGNSIFPADIDVTTPAYRVATLAFVNELTAMAPTGITADWVVLGSVITALVEADGDAAQLKLPDGVDSAAVEAAGGAIDAHAQSECGLSIQ